MLAHHQFQSWSRKVFNYLSFRGNIVILQKFGNEQSCCFSSNITKIMINIIRVIYYNCIILPRIQISYKGWVFNGFIFRCCHKMSPATHLYFQAPTFPTDIPFSMKKIFTYVRFEILQCCLCVSIYAAIIITCSKLCLHSFIYIILNQIRIYPFGFGTPKVHVHQLYYILWSSQLFIC